MTKLELKQKRSRETKQKIIGAAKKLFLKEGYQGVNTNTIAAEAGVSVGSFYYYFDDKKDVYFAVMDRFSDEMRAYMEKAFSDLGSDLTEEQLILELVRMSIRAHKKSAGLIRISEGLRSMEPDIGDRINASHEEFIGLLKELLSGAEEARGIRIEDAEVKAKVIVTTVESLCRENLLYGLGIEEEKLARELKDLIIGYLTMSSEST